MLVVNGCSKERSVQMEAFRSIKHVWLQKVTPGLQQLIMVIFPTTEVEYMIATHAYKESIWLKRPYSNI